MKDIVAMSGTEQLTVPIQVATVVVPVGVYFFILGLLNSRAHPQLLTGKIDFALLITAWSPIFVFPMLDLLGISIGTALLSVIGIAALVVFLGPGKGNWVIYNLSFLEAKSLLRRLVYQLDKDAIESRSGFELPACQVRIEIGGFGLLKNISIRLHGGNENFSILFQQDLAAELNSISTETSPMAVTLLLVATCMLVAPVTLMARHTSEIVRIITDLLP